MNPDKDFVSSTWRELSIPELLRISWAGRWLVLGTLVACGLLGLLLSFLWPKTYEAIATVFPVSSSGGNSLAQYAGLANLAGVELPIAGSSSSPAKTVNALLASRLLAETVVQEMGLTTLIESPGTTAEEKFRSLVDLLQKGLSSKEDSKTGVISVTVKLKDAKLAQDVTNRLIEILDRLLAEKSFTTNKKKQEQLTRQIVEQGEKVSNYQRQMAQFQKETTLLDPKAQAGKAMDAYTTLVQQRMELELQLATAQSSYSSDNPRVSLLQNQLKNLEDQIVKLKNQVDGDLPSLKLAPDNMIRYQNLARDLEIATKIYATLLASMEQVKLDSDQDQVYIEILDKALLPETGSPSRFLVVLGSLVIGLLLGLVFVFSRFVLKELGHAGSIPATRPSA